MDRRKDVIRVVSRVDGERTYSEYKPDYTFYYEHPSGSHRSIFGDPLKKFTTHNGRDFKKEVASAAMPDKRGKTKKIFESDINPVFRLLADKFRDSATPKLNICYFDIETEFNPAKGYAPTTNPFAPVTAISLYLGWQEKLITLALAPPSMPYEDAAEIGERFEDTIVFDDEIALLDTFLLLIEDADILTGWNSEGYDIPYLVNRVARVMEPSDLARFCLWNEKPREREYEKFKKKFKTYDLLGRVHLDYLLLYQKHNPQQLHSYRLDYVGEIEVGENKIPFEGTFEDLWLREFEKFIAYSRQDTLLLPKIDKKKKFIELANQIAHSNCVLLKTTMGSVALVEQAIINDMHEMGGLIAPDRKRTLQERHVEELIAAELAAEDGEDEAGGPMPVVGAYVARPKIGLHDEVACADINSLYPSAIRALNMSVETIFGQFRPDETTSYIAARVAELGPKKRAEAWDGIFHCLEYGHVMAEDDTRLTVDFEDGTSKTMTGAQWYAYLFNPANHVCVTANGTIFKTNRDGIIPTLLGKWYAERQSMQAREKEFKTLAGETAISQAVADAIRSHAPAAIEFDQTTLEELLEAEEFAAVAAYLEFYELIIVENKIVPATPEVRTKLKDLETFWNQRQQARKILLNSLYGALLNDSCRFYDARVGQSVTLTGRMIVQHMNANINQTITGVYDYKGDAIVYADTDSCYFSSYNLWKDDPAYKMIFESRENTIQFYDGVADITNESFPSFMMRSFNTSEERGGIIKAGRELVASRALFIKKKKYACLMYDKDGTRLDVKGKAGKLKPMGLDLKRADTPKFMQVFLENLLMDVLTGASQRKMYDDIKQFRKEFVNRPAWEKGTPKKVNALSDYIDQDEAASAIRITDTVKRGQKLKINIPWNVKSARNWNTLRKHNGDLYSMEIGDGAKVIVCRLRPNVMKMDHVAYPIDEPHLPQWYKDLPFDHAAMENIIIDKKLDNLIGVLDWDLAETKEQSGDEFFVFN